MKIEGPRPAGTAPIRKDGKSVGSGFSEALGTEAPSAPSAVAPAPSVGGVAALLALQEVDPADADRSAAERGEEILDRLEELRIGLLLGRIAPDRLGQLAALSRDASRAAHDPRLKAVLDEIELRAEVELAKLAGAT